MVPDPDAPAGRARSAAWIAIAAFVLAHAAFALLPGVLGAWDSRVVDRLFRLRAAGDARPQYGDLVWLGVLDDDTRARLGKAYLERDDLARVVRNLASAGVATQAWDMIFAAPTTDDGDRALIEATREAGTVILGQALLPGGATVDAEPSLPWNVRVIGDRNDIPEPAGGVVSTFAALAGAAAGVAHLNVAPDFDGVYRRVPLVLRRGDTLVPGLALRAVCNLLDVPPERVVLRPGHSVRLEGVRIGDAPARDLVIPVDAQTRLVVNYAGAWTDFEHHMNVADLWRVSRARMRALRKQLDGKLVVVTDASTGSGDTGPVPTDAFYPKGGIHVTAMQSMLAGTFLRELAGWRGFLPEILLIGAVVGVARRGRALWISLGIVAVSVLYVAAAGLAFVEAGWILPVVRPLLGLALALVGIVAVRYHLEEVARQVLRHSFEAYFPPALVRRIVRDPSALDTGGHKKTLTLLFSDIKDFSKHSSTMDPADVQRRLNEYFEAMVRIVFEHGGTVDKFIGDGLMVFFGDPDPQDDHALRCVQAAREMQAATGRLRETWVAGGAFPLTIRIGIHTGEVVVGNMGSRQRLAYTALGANVNLAARLESAAPPGGILISDATHRLVASRVETRPVGKLEVKGFDTPVTAFEVV